MLGTALALFLIASSGGFLMATKRSSGLGFALCLSSCLYLLSFAAALGYEQARYTINMQSLLPLIGVVSAWGAGLFLGSFLMLIVHRSIAHVVIWFGIAITAYWFLSFVQGERDWFDAGHEISLPAFHYLWVAMHNSADGPDLIKTILAIAMTYGEISWIKTQERWQKSDELSRS